MASNIGKPGNCVLIVYWVMLMIESTSRQPLWIDPLAWTIYISCSYWYHNIAMVDTHLQQSIFHSKMRRTRLCQMFCGRWVHMWDVWSWIWPERRDVQMWVIFRGVVWLRSYICLMLIFLNDWNIYSTWVIPWILMSWRRKEPGVRFSIKMPSYQYRDPHVKDKTVSRLSYL